MNIRSNIAMKDAVGMIFKHGEDDYEFWQFDSPKNLQEFLAENELDGCSTRGTLKQIMEDIRESN